METADIILLTIFTTTLALSLVQITFRFPSLSFLWILIDHLQLILLFPLIDTFIHGDVVQFVKNFRYVLWNFNFINLKENNILKEEVKNYDMRYEWLKKLDFKTLSMLYSNKNVIALFIFLFFINLMVILIKGWILWKKKANRDDLDQGVYKENLEVWNYFVSIIEKLENKWFFAIYVTIFMITCQSFLIASIAEIYAGGSKKKFSLYSSVFCLFIIAAFLLFILAYFQYNYKDYDHNATFFYVLNLELKNTSSARIHSFSFLLRKILFVAIVICTNFGYRDITLLTLLLIQVFYTIQKIYILKFQKLLLTIIHWISEFFIIFYIVFIFIRGEK